MDPKDPSNTSKSDESALKKNSKRKPATSSNLKGNTKKPPPPKRKPKPLRSTTEEEISIILKYLLKSDGKLKVDKRIDAELMDELNSRLDKPMPDVFWRKALISVILKIKNENISNLNSKEKEIRERYDRMLIPLKLIKTVQGHEFALNDCAFDPRLIKQVATDGENIRNFYSEITWKTTYPVPIIISDVDFETFDDKTKSLVEQKAEFHTKLTKVKQLYAKVTQKEANIIKEKEKDSRYHRQVVKYAQILETDPDPYFKNESVYNYFFAGAGNIDVVLLELDTPIIVRVVGENMDQIELIPFNFDSKEALNLDKNRQIFSLDLSQKQSIHELCHVVNGENLFIGARQRNIVSVIQLPLNDLNLENKVAKKYTRYFGQPFTSAIISKCAQYLFVSLSDEKEILVYSVESEQVLYTLKIDKIQEDYEDNWITMACYDSKRLIVVDRDFVRFYKITEKQLILDTTISKSDHLIKCDIFCCIALSNYGNMIYVGSKHRVLAIEIREVKEENKERVLLCNKVIVWGHMLLIPPSYIKTVLNSMTDEVVCICSNLVGDFKVMIVEVNAEKSIVDYETASIIPSFSTRHLPFCPSSPKDSLNVVKLSGKCLHPKWDLKKRVTVGITGIFLLEHEGKTIILLQNAIGDVFLQKIIDKSEESNELEIVDLFEKWEQKMKKIPNKTVFSVTCLAPMKSMRKLYDVEKLTLPKEEEIPERPKRYPKWRQSIEKLHRYKDLLAPTLLAPWNFDRKDELEAVEIQASDATLEERMRDWFDRSVPFATSTQREGTVQNNESVLEDSKEATRLEISRLTDISLDNTGAEQLIVAKLKTKKRRTYVQGF